VIDEIHARARPLLRSPALLGGEQRRPWSVARKGGSAGAAQPCACRNLSGVYRRFMHIAGVPSLGSLLFLGGVTLFLN
jgi:hypothetical protein